MKHSLIILVLFCNLSLVGQSNRLVTEQEIDSIIQQYMQAYRIVGLSIGIVKEGKTYLAKGYGKVAVNTPTLVNEKTNFLLSSIGKTFTAAAVMQLAEQGKIDINKKLIDYLPDFKMKDKRYKEITIVQLLTHSSGFGWDNEMENSQNDSTSLKAFIGSLYNAKIKFKPGEKFSGETYSNTGFDILGYLVEVVSGIKYEQYIQKYLLSRANMFNSTFNHRDIEIQAKALPYILDGNSKEIKRFNLYGIVKDKNPILKYPSIPLKEYEKYGTNKEHDPSGNLISTSEDMCNWMLHHLAIYNDTLQLLRAILTRNTLQNMWTTQLSIPNRKTGIGLGWWTVADEKTGNYVFHVGRDPGFCATLVIFPERNLGITVLCNGKYADQVVWNKIPFEITNLFK
jgi:CubicO group peptidase (beta-lactamase class C family)